MRHGRAVYGEKNSYILFVIHHKTQRFTDIEKFIIGLLDQRISQLLQFIVLFIRREVCVTLIRKVVGQMTASGLRTVDYASGHSNRVDVAIRRALLTGMGQLTGRISDMNGQRLGNKGFFSASSRAFASSHSSE